MNVSDQARDALVLASAVARGRGEQQVDAYHLLVGLAEGSGGARHVLGVEPAGLSAAPATFDTAQQVVGVATAAARRAGQVNATTTDILQAILGPVPGPLDPVLAGAGADPAAIRIALAGPLHEDCCGETAYGSVHTALISAAAHAADLPGRGRATLSLLLGIVPALLLYALVLVRYVGTGKGPFLGIAAAMVLLQVLPVLFASRHRERAAVTRGTTEIPLPAGAQPLLDRLGLRRLEIRVGPDDMPSRSHRVLGQAWIVFSGRAARFPEPAEFTVWDELAALARRESTARVAGVGLYLGLLVAALLSGHGDALPVAAAGAAVLAVAGNWWSRVARDRIVGRRLGAATLHYWINRTGSRSRVLGPLATPPKALRRALYPLD